MLTSHIETPLFPIGGEASRGGEGKATQLLIGNISNSPTCLHWLGADERRASICRASFTEGLRGRTKGSEAAVHWAQHHQGGWRQAQHFQVCNYREEREGYRTVSGSDAGSLLPSPMCSCPTSSLKDPGIWRRGRASWVEESEGLQRRS